MKPKPYFIQEPFGLPRELQPAGKFRTAYDDLDTIARLMFGKPYKNLTPAQQERARIKNKMIYPDRNVLITREKLMRGQAVTPKELERFRKLAKVV